MRFRSKHHAVWCKNINIIMYDLYVCRFWYYAVFSQIFLYPDWILTFFWVFSLYLSLYFRPPNICLDRLIYIRRNTKGNTWEWTQRYWYAWPSKNTRTLTRGRDIGSGGWTPSPRRSWGLRRLEGMKSSEMRYGCTKGNILIERITNHKDGNNQVMKGYGGVS